MADSAFADVLLQSTSNQSLIVRNLIEKLRKQIDEQDGSSATDLSTAQFLVSVANRVAESGATSKDQINALTSDLIEVLVPFIRRVYASVDIVILEDKVRGIAKLCCNTFEHMRPALLRRLVKDSSEILNDTVQACYSKDLQDETLRMDKTWLGKSISNSVFHDSPEPLEVSATLAFLRYVSWQDAISAGPLSALTRPLLTLQAASSQGLAASARDTLLAMLSSSTEADMLLPDPASFKENTFGVNDVWLHIFDLVGNEFDTYHHTNGYSIWLAIITHRPDWLLRSSRVNEAAYWMPLANTLALGSQQQRKLCLAILKASIWLAKENIDCSAMHFDISKKQELLKRYEKYATLYITIVMNRYLNQVQNCLQELHSLLSLDSGVDTAWLVSLLSASVDKGMQDSVRKLFGAWIMEHAAEVLSRKHADVDFLLRSRFLPWAVNGTLFVSSLTLVDHEISCQHGEKLTNFVKSLVVLPEEDDNRMSIVHIILQYMDEHNDHVFPYAKAYILQGLADGLHERALVLNQRCGELLLRVASQGGYLEVVGRWMGFTLAQVADYVGDDFKKGSLQRACEEAKGLSEHGVFQLKDPCTAARVLGGEINPAHEYPSVASFCRWLEASRYQCLTQDGLLAGCVYLLHALDQHDVQADLVLFALEAIWEQLEIQDYARDALMMSPALLLHSTCVKLSAKNDDLLSFISAKIEVIQDMSQHRMYLFSSLAQALRQATIYEAATDVLPLSEIILRFANNPPTTKAEFQLEEVFSSKLQRMVPSVSYETFYGKSEARAYAAFFDMLNAMQDTSENRQHCLKALDALLTPWVKQKQPLSVTSKWKNTTQLQVILLLTQRCLPQSSPQEVDGYLKTYLELIAIEPLPRYRYLLEWIISRIFFSFRERTEILERMQQMDMSNPKLTVSMVKIALGLACVHDAKEEFAVELMTQLMVLAASPKVAIRHEGQWSIPILWDHASEKNWLKILENPVVVRINTWLRTLEPYKKPPPNRLLDRFDPHREHNLSNLLDGDYLTMDPVEASRTNYSEFVSLYEDESRTTTHTLGDNDSIVLPLGLSKHTPQGVADTATRALEPLTAAMKTLTTSSEKPAEPTAPLQTKGTSWRSDIDALLSGTSSFNTTAKRRPRDLIVVASLIDSVINIGGLSRVSEIFGAARLVVADRRVLTAREFTSVAVSSELWLPVDEVAGTPDALVPWLRAQQLAGYAVVGIEQTDDSRVLGAAGAVLPERLVLVLGSEREGIPARVLGACDWCVEIPQRGVTRSMNVQTAAAVVLFEYDRQRSSSAGDGGVGGVSGGVEAARR